MWGYTRQTALSHVRRFSWVTLLRITRNVDVNKSTCENVLCKQRQCRTSDVFHKGISICRIWRKELWERPIILDIQLSLIKEKLYLIETAKIVRQWRHISADDRKRNSTFKVCTFFISFYNKYQFWNQINQNNSMTIDTNHIVHQ